MAKVEFSALHLIRIEINGENQGDFKVRKDDGLVSKFLEWAFRENLWSARGGMSGGGRHVGFYLPEDEAKIRAWLKENDVEEVKPTGGW